jgi:uncharacterized protein (DUF433 family)
MIVVPDQSPAIIRTERGLTIAGTRISLYDVMDLLNAQYPATLIRDKLNLTAAQIKAALSYIQTNQTQVDADYQDVLKTRDEIQTYWDEQNRDRLITLATISRNPEQQELWEKLEQQKADRASVGV